MEIRLLTRGELDQSLDLVWKVFCEYEAVNYTEDSRQVFYDAIHSKDYLDMLTAYGAFDESGLEETEDGGIVYIPMEYLHFQAILHAKEY